MNKFNLEITYKDICSVSHITTPSGDELVVEVLGGSIIKAYHYEKLPFGKFESQARSSNERYEALHKVVNDYLRYAKAINDGNNSFIKTLEEVEAELEEEDCITVTAEKHPGGKRMGSINYTCLK